MVEEDEVMARPDRRSEVATQFKADVVNHKMDVLLDNGVYRHLVFSQPKNGWHHRFDLVTYPGYLVISGDMSCWVFSRVDDMFQFFRSDDGRINPGYWSEKIQNGASGGRDEGREYDGEAYKAALIEHLDGYDLSDDHKAAVIEELDQLDFCDEFSIFSQINDFEVYLDEPDPEIPIRELARNAYSRPRKRKSFTFQDVWEISSKVFSYHFLWCCHAIAWGINRYDESKLVCKDAGLT